MLSDLCSPAPAPSTGAGTLIACFFRGLARPGDCCVAAAGRCRSRGALSVAGACPARSPTAPCWPSPCAGGTVSAGALLCEAWPSDLPSALSDRTCRSRVQREATSLLDATGADWRGALCLSRAPLDAADRLRSPSLGLPHCSTICTPVLRADVDGSWANASCSGCGLERRAYAHCNREICSKHRP